MGLFGKYSAMQLLALGMLCLVALSGVSSATLDSTASQEQHTTTVFAAVAKGHGKGKLLSVLGVQKIKKICTELEDNKSFQCKRVWGTGASGTILNEKEEAWLSEEVSRIVKKLRLDGVAGVQWRAAADVPLIDIAGKKKNPNTHRVNHSWFGKEQQVELFKSRKWGAGQVGQIDRSRQLIAAQSVSDEGVPVETTIQHDAPLPLGFLSAYAGGCAARCNDPSKFTYGSDGTGVTVYIVDGSVADHEEFQDMNTGETRLREDRHYSAAAQLYEGQACAADHGTHVASLAAGFESGAGKGASIVSVAVQPGCGEPGYASDLEEGLDWVLEKHLAQPEPRKPGIVSMSLIISKQSSSAELISEKVEELIENGIIVVAAAGNFHEDSCDYIPSGLPGVITVAAVDVTHDATKAFPWSWSNYGACVDIWAPGVDIVAAAPDCYECSATYSGTSQATPLVTGLVAQYLSINPTADAEDVKKELTAHAATTVLEVVGHPYDTTTHAVAQTSVLSV